MLTALVPESTGPKGSLPAVSSLSAYLPEPVPCTYSRGSCFLGDKGDVLYLKPLQC